MGAGLRRAGGRGARVARHAGARAAGLGARRRLRPRAQPSGPQPRRARAARRRRAGAHGAVRAARQPRARRAAQRFQHAGRKRYSPRLPRPGPPERPGRHRPGSPPSRSERPATMTDAPRAFPAWLPPLFLAILSIGLYAPTLNYGLVYDDSFLIADNTSVTPARKDLSVAFELFGREYWEGVQANQQAALQPRGQALYRPLTLFLWALIVNVNGLSSTWPLSLIHISEPTRLLSISYAVFCLKKKN